MKVNIKFMDVCPVVRILTELQFIRETFNSDPTGNFIQPEKGKNKSTY